jgi:cysteine desulfurase
MRSRLASIRIYRAVQLEDISGTWILMEIMAMAVISLRVPAMYPIYLDHASTTPVATSVRESMIPFLNQLFGHPSSLHWMGRAACEAIEDARSHLATLLECHPSELIFTSGGTESINLGLLGVGRAIGHSLSSPHCIISNLEHAAVKQTANQLKQEGWQVSVVQCSRYGQVEPEEIEKLIRKETRLVSIAHASYQLGTVQPLERISQLCCERDILLHTDAAQSVGKIPCQVASLGVDLLSLSGHKFFAPKGVGALYLRPGIPIEPILYGEGVEVGLRPGTQNVAHIVALGQAAKLAQAGLGPSMDRVARLKADFHAQLQNLIGRELPVISHPAEILPGVLVIEMPNVSAEELQRNLPEICFGPPNTCNGRLNLPTDNVFNSMGIDRQRWPNILRISIGWTNSDEELNKAAHRIATTYELLSGGSAAG